jgi:enhancing lycopene biosynthesis protein 2
MPEKRNVLIEAARIARGKIEPLDRLDMERYDALIMPGGFGVAKNLSDFAFKGGDCTVIPEVEKAIKDTVKLGKPLGALCISPAVVARVLEGVEVTVGQDPATIEGIEAMGGRHKKTNHGEVIYDEKYRVYTTPCYMLDATIDEVWSGAKNIVAAITEALS